MRPPVEGDALVEQGWPTKAERDPENGRVYLEIHKPDQLDFIYEVRLREYLRPDFAYPEMRRTDNNEQHIGAAAGKPVKAIF